tara:strand:- start:4080 stop:4295 length:216 start_codon:yes stop_codon:yes gene_type:complete
MKAARVLIDLFRCKAPPKLLGRWNLKNCNVKESVSALYANTDHCGDSLCGNPKQIKEEKEKISQKDKSIEK